MKDKLPERVKKTESAIVNLDNSENSGTHWICYIKEGNTVKYYDSFGVDPPLELINYWGEKSTVLFNYNQDQEINEVICGHLCLEFFS